MIKKTAFYIPNFRIASLLAVSAMALGLAGCDKMREPTVGEKLDSAIDKTQRAAENAKDAMAAAQRKMEEGAAKTEQAAHDAAQAARDAGNAARESLDKSR